MRTRTCLANLDDGLDSSACLPDFVSGNGYGNLGGYGGGYAGGHGYGPRADGGVDGGNGYYIDGTGNIGDMPFTVTNDDSRRTERIFRCAGCIGGCECPIHGVRL